MCPVLRISTNGVLSYLSQPSGVGRSSPYLFYRTKNWFKVTHCTSFTPCPLGIFMAVAGNSVVCTDQAGLEPHTLHSAVNKLHTAIGVSVCSPQLKRSLSYFLFLLFLPLQLTENAAAPGVRLQNQIYIQIPTLSLSTCDLELVTSCLSACFPICKTPEGSNEQVLGV